MSLESNAEGAEEKNGSAEIIAALERVLSQPDFQASPRLSSFLRFVVTETLEGRANRLKAFTIASMALGHDEKFNPKTNSVVRVQAGRLRNLLEHYYQGAGCSERCEIRLRRGSYVPEFLWRSEDDVSGPPLASAPDSPAESREPSGVARRFAFRWPSRSAALAAAVFTVAMALALGAGFWREGAPAVFFPGGHAVPPVESTWNGLGATITIGPIEGIGNDPTLRAFTDALTDRLEDALSAFDNPVVLHGDVPVPTPADLAYRLSGRVIPAPDGTISLSFRIWRPVSGEIIWSRTFDDISLEKSKLAFEPAVDSLTSAIAQTYGVVFTDLRKQLRGHSEGFGCVILASIYFKTPSAAAHATARDCLERTLAQHADFAPGFAALSYLLVDTYLNGVDARPGEQPLDLAIEMANRSVDLAPQKARAHTAMFETRFFDKRFADAFASADQALRLNPYATDTAARVGLAYALRGEFDKGIALLESAVRFNPSPPGWYEFPFFLDAHMRGDDKSAFRHAMRHASTRFPLGIMARIIVAHQQGDAAAVAQWTQRLSTDYPVVASDIPATFDRYAIAPSVATRLLADLKDAGLPPPTR